MSESRVITRCKRTPYSWSLWVSWCICCTICVCMSVRWVKMPVSNRLGCLSEQEPHLYGYLSGYNDYTSPLSSTLLSPGPKMAFITAPHANVICKYRFIRSSAIPLLFPPRVSLFPALFSVGGKSGSVHVVVYFQPEKTHTKGNK